MLLFFRKSVQLLAFAAYVSHCDDFSVEIISPGIAYVSSLSSLPMTGPAIDIGVEDIQRIYSNYFQVKLTYLYNLSILNCDDAAAGFDYMVSDYYYRKRRPVNLTLFTYPGCYMEAIAVAKLGAGWNQLVLVGSYNENTWRNKALYPNLIQAGPIMARPILAVILSIFQKFSWRTVYVVCDKGGTAGAVSVIGSQAVTARLRATPGSVAYLSTVDTTKNDTFTATIRDIKTTARIISFWGHANALRKFMIEAHQNNMTNGEYVYVALGPFEYPTPLYGNITWQYNDEFDEIAFEAYKSLFVVIPSSSGEALIRRSKSKYNYTYKPGDVPNPIVVTQIGCIHMLGTIINETLTGANGSSLFIENSGGLAKRFWNRTIQTPVGPFSFDEVGERRVQQEVQQMNLSTGKFEAFMYQDPYTFRLVSVKPLVWFSGDLPRDIPECGFTGQTGPCALAAENARRAVIAIAVGVIVGVTVVLVSSALIVRKLTAESQLKATKFYLDSPLVFSENLGTGKEKAHETALYKEQPVSVVRYPLSNYEKSKTMSTNREFLICVKGTLDLFHPNISRFIGIELQTDAVLLVYNYCQRGTLKRFLTSPQITLDWDLKSGLAIDLLQGVKAINTGIPMRYHGLVCCSTCMINNHFNLKITDFTAPSMLRSGFSLDYWAECSSYDQFHIAPEIVRSRDFKATTAKSHMYSIGTVIVEIVMEAVLEKHSMTPLNAEGAPSMAVIKKPSLQKAIWKCMEEDPSSRTTLDKLLHMFKADSGKRTVVEKVIRTLSKYANDLEHAVALRTQDLLTERQKCDALLQHMLPATVVEKLRRQEIVHPETFESVTLQFSDIVGFMEFVRDVLPFDVVEFLNKSHGLFDETISGFEVYKVETISDSYFIASGLPKRIGDKHACEMCRAALCLMQRFREKFSQSDMQLRIGIHTGSCVAAVAGLQRPRYCLFGDTVNTTSRMESHGEGSRIHLSSVTARLLTETTNELECISRGSIQIKGKGEMETFWLRI
ncbi:atrial natriuretic peptide receptor 1-like [Paramacrobiotus metropolitanus]|uniref:atrial natriuretic peptide receptor 1-like n=1 Tax=Paramacrobiotus metropolitanus TaxID=2943436 RepID=UPI0024456D12|nr:atrial natriuretic peptide receptor 1-like [Paramacrobiotus metropolitanus]